MNHEITVKISRKSTNYPVKVEAGSLATVPMWVNGKLEQRHQKVFLISNKRVFGFYGDSLLKGFERSSFDTYTHLIGDGERFKNLKTTGELLNAFAKAGLKRSDLILALGGGVVGDAAGFAASIYQRGIPVIQIPTTLVSMVDSSVGGKTGVNLSFGKNLAGTFSQPDAVFVDILLLSTLPRRELNAGAYEVLKHGILSGGKLFSASVDTLQVIRKLGVTEVLAKDALREQMNSLIAEQIRFKAQVVRGDEMEDPARTDPRSRKILNLGHTFGHALEKVTNYRYLKHGEAVGYGLLFAAELSKKLELLDKNTLELLNDVVHRVGVLPPINHIDRDELLNAFRSDKKSSPSGINWVLLEDIGKPLILSEKDIGRTAISHTFRKFVS